MKMQYQISPFFLDEYYNELEQIKVENAKIISTDLTRKTQTENIAKIHTKIKSGIREILKSGKMPISIAGDCVSTIAILAALQQNNINPILIWFDAHADFNTEETTISNHLGGMPLAKIFGLGNQQLCKNVQLKQLKKEEIFLVDGRDLDEKEAELLTKSEITHLKKIKEILNIDFKNRPIYIHFDTDIISSKVVKAQNYPSIGGPTIKDLKNVFTYLKQTNRVAAFSVSSWNPKLDKDKSSQKICMDLVKIFE